MVTTDVQPRKEVERVPEVAQNSPLSREQLIVDHKNDPEIYKLAEEVFGSEEESDVGTCYYCSEGILMMNWQPLTASADEEWQVVHQVVVPKMYRREVLHLAHASPMAGHLGINKTYQKVLSHF